jgi:hypothetical protein
MSQFTTQQLADGFDVSIRNIQKHVLNLTENSHFIVANSGSSINKQYLLNESGVKKLSEMVNTPKAKEFANQLAISESFTDPKNPLFWQKLTQQNQIAINYLQEALERTQKELDHKQSIIQEKADLSPVKSQRIILTEIIRKYVEKSFEGKEGEKPNPKHYRQAWDFLGREFCKRFHIDLKARSKGFEKRTGKKISRLDIAENLGCMNDLYNTALKVFETEAKTILQ